MVFVVLWLFVTHVLEMRLLGAIMDKLVSVGVLALLILFQEEIRKFLYSLGAHQRFKNIFRLFYTATKKEDEDKEAIMPIVMACMNLSRGKVGALIVIEPTTPLTDIMSHDMDIPKELGLRHRAAMGISQSSDAIAIVVSEETGRIAVAIRGTFRLRLSAEELESILAQQLIS